MNQTSINDEDLMDDDRHVTLHMPKDFESMRKAGQLAAEVLDMITPYVVPGITTEEINTRCHDYIISHGAIPAPLNYRGFPKSVCTSVNHVVCHGIPGEQPLKQGDIVNIDVTVIVDGWHGDTSRMYWVGDAQKISIKARRLTEVTYECLMKAIDIARPGTTLGDIGHVIQEHAEKNRFSIVRDYCGHGIGKLFHCAPNVLHYGRKSTGLELQEGMFFTIEPMLNAGTHRTILSKLDGWTVTTRDKSLSAQFEHSIGITRDGCEIFTASPKGYTKPPYN